MGRNLSLIKLPLLIATLIWITIASTAAPLKNYNFNVDLSFLHLPAALTNAKTLAVEAVAPTKVIPAAIPTDDLQCMAENIYYEAGNQSFVGKIAVGQVVLNRTKMPGYPRTICGVIYDGSQNVHTSVCQFSWTCASRLNIDKSSAFWGQSLKAAKELLYNKDKLIDITEGATNYHADYVTPPWARQLHVVAKIDQHIFYRKI